MFKDLPEGQTNSFQAQVLAVWPDAYISCYRADGKYWVVREGGKELGRGKTEADAWQNAASKLPKGG